MPYPVLSSFSLARDSSVLFLFQADGSAKVDPVNRGKARLAKERGDEGGDERDSERMRGTERGQRILERVLFQRNPKGESIGFSAGSHGDREANRTIHAISDEDVERASYHHRNHPPIPYVCIHLFLFLRGVSRKIPLPAFNLFPFISSLLRPAFLFFLPRHNVIFNIFSPWTTLPLSRGLFDRPLFRLDALFSFYARCRAHGYLPDTSDEAG